MLFTTEEDQMMINLVKRNPVLYMLKSRRFKDHEMKNKIWKRIANKLGKTEIECKTRWKSMRDYYLRRRRISILKGETSGNVKKLNHQLQFLDALLDQLPSKRKKTVDAENSESTNKADSLKATNEENESLSSEQEGNLKLAIEEEETSNLSNSESEEGNPTANLSDFEMEEGNVTSNLTEEKEEEETSNFDLQKETENTTSKLHEEKEKKENKKASKSSNEKETLGLLEGKTDINTSFSKKEKKSKTLKSTEIDGTLNLMENSIKSHEEENAETVKLCEKNKNSEISEFNKEKETSESPVNEGIETPQSIKGREKETNKTKGKEKKTLGSDKEKETLETNKKKGKENKTLESDKEKEALKTNENEGKENETLESDKEKEALKTNEKKGKENETLESDKEKEISKSLKGKRKVPIVKFTLKSSKRKEILKPLVIKKEKDISVTGETSTIQKEKKRNPKLPKEENEKASKLQKGTEENPELSREEKPLITKDFPDLLQKSRNTGRDKRTSKFAKNSEEVSETSEKISSLISEECFIVPKEEPVDESLDFEIIYDKPSESRRKSGRISNVSAFQTKTASHLEQDTREAPSHFSRTRRSSSIATRGEVVATPPPEKKAKTAVSQTFKQPNKISNVDPSTALFFRSIAETVTAFPPDLKSQAKIMVLQLISDLESSYAAGASSMP